MIFETLLKWHERSKVGYSPMVDKWYLFGSPLPILSILVTYVILVKYVGPRYMRNRKPYDLIWAIRLYNLFQIVYNISMLILACSDPGYFPNFFSFGCASLDPTQPAVKELDLYRAFWHYMINKMVDFIDTLFFVLRKKQSHVTFLHVFHHVSMVFVCWLTLKYFPGMEPQVATFINASIHILMYTYYFFSSLGVSFIYKFKKILTLAQILQFVLVMLYYSLATQLSCNFNLIVIYIITFEAFANLILFVNFYRKTYGSKDRLVSMQKMMMCAPLQGQYGLDENQNVKKDE